AELNRTRIVPETALTLWLGEIEQKAKQFTVRIDSSKNDSRDNGSGVIIAKQGDIYTVLTSGHVFKPCTFCTYTILAPDGKPYPVEKSSIKVEKGVDLAVVKFRSSATYQIATLASYNPKNYEYILTAGYPKLGEISPWRLTIGHIFSKEQGLFETTESEFKNNSVGSLTSIIPSPVSLTGGYELVYSSITFGGMSGGPVLDTQGRVIGIHGSSEAEIAIDEETKDFGSSEGKVQIGHSLGIPISTFLAIANRLDAQAQKVETTPAPQLNQQQVMHIRLTILSFNIPSGNTTASQWIERGNQMWRLRVYEAALEAFDRAIKLKPQFIHLAYYGKSLALWSNRQDSDDLDNSEAIAVLQTLEQAVIYKPDFVLAWSKLSIVYRELKQLDKALVAINKAIQFQPNNPNLYNVKFNVLSDLKNYIAAERAITKAIYISPRASFYYSRGIIYDTQKKLELALDDFNTAIKINPDLATPYIGRGFVYREQKKWELALADFNTVIKINPDLATPYIGRGFVYREQKKWELALADFNTVIKINPDLATPYIGRGFVYREQKKWELALADFNTTIKIIPNNGGIYVVRGYIYFELGDKQKGIQDLIAAALLFQSQGNTAAYEETRNILNNLLTQL
ncbi:tetratricopeptide repeat protein, partial [Anabaena sp. UHCC 0253]|uniref:tetratricopeptide repeat protein n=1 Tax=Anabaena sp. UHCC 0253 TaxID=2590019 RepID=UPI001445C201